MGFIVEIYAVTICHSGKGKGRGLGMEMINQPLLHQSFGYGFKVFTDFKFIHQSDSNEVLYFYLNRQATTAPNTAIT